MELSSLQALVENPFFAIAAGVVSLIVVRFCVNKKIGKGEFKLYWKWRDRIYYYVGGFAAVITVANLLVGNLRLEIYEIQSHVDIRLTEIELLARSVANSCEEERLRPAAVIIKDHCRDNRRILAIFNNWVAGKGREGKYGHEFSGQLSVGKWYFQRAGSELEYFPPEFPCDMFSEGVRLTEPCSEETPRLNDQFYMARWTQLVPEQSNIARSQSENQQHFINRQLRGLDKYRQLWETKTRLFSYANPWRSRLWFLSLILLGVAFGYRLGRITHEIRKIRINEDPDCLHGWAIFGSYLSRTRMALVVKLGDAVQWIARQRKNRKGKKTN